jgi:hypothetical protein
MVRLVRDFLVQEHAKLVAEPMPPILSKLVARFIDKRSHSLPYVRVHFWLWLEDQKFRNGFWL